MKVCDRCRVGFDDDNGLDWNQDKPDQAIKFTLCNECCRIYLEEALIIGDIHPNHVDSFAKGMK